MDDYLFLMVYETDSLCSPEKLDLVRYMTWNLEDLEGVEEVYSLTNIDRMSLEEGLLANITLLPVLITLARPTLLR